MQTAWPAARQPITIAVLQPIAFGRSATNPKLGAPLVSFQAAAAADEENDEAAEDVRLGFLPVA